MTQKCPRCGNEIPKPVNNCTQCGKKIDSGRKEAKNPSRVEGCLVAIVGVNLGFVALLMLW